MNARLRTMLLGTLFLLAVSGTVGSAPLMPYEVQQTTLDLNYGNYLYIEAFRWRPYRVLPHNELGRQQQRLEVWLRSLPRKYAVFALTLALREVERLSLEVEPTESVSDSPS